MTQTERTRAVHTLIVVLADPAALGVDSTSATGALERLRALVHRAIASSRTNAEHLVNNEFGMIASFLNSGAGLTFVRVLQHQAKAEFNLPIRVGVHLGSLGGEDDHLDQRAPVRLARQIAALAHAGQCLASPLFHNFVTQFDHRCKSMLKAIPPVIDSQGRSVQVFEISFADLPALRFPTAVEAAAASNDPIAMPSDSTARLEFLDRVERVLADEIGPLANLIVRQAAEAAHTRAAFYRHIADTLPETVQRETFFKALDQL